MTDEPEVFELLRKIRYDATAIQAKVTEALTMLADMNLPAATAATHPCPKCGHHFKTQQRLTEHLFNVHAVGDPPPLTVHEEQAV